MPVLGLLGGVVVFLRRYIALRKKRKKIRKSKIRLHLGDQSLSLKKIIQLLVFLVLWSLSVLDIVSDIYLNVEMLEYTFTPPPSCEAINYIFPRVPWEDIFLDGTHQGRACRQRLGDAPDFATHMESMLCANEEANFEIPISIYEQEVANFVQICSSLESCRVTPTGMLPVCTNTNDPVIKFQLAVLFCFALMLLKEVIKVAVILKHVFYHHGEISPRFIPFVMYSPMVGLIAFRTRGRHCLFHRVVGFQTTHSDRALAGA